MDEEKEEPSGSVGGWLDSYLEAEPWKAGEPERTSRGRLRKGVKLNATGRPVVVIAPEVPIPNRDTQLDDMRWAYHNPRAQPKTAGQEFWQKQRNDDPKSFGSLKTQMETRAAAFGATEFVGEQSKEAVVDEKSEELLAWGRAWLEELRGRKK